MPTEWGDPEVALGNEILRTVVGSGVHGIAIEGTDDHDEMGVYIEPPAYLFGFDDQLRDNYVARTADEGQRSHHGDTDLVMYSLRRYLGLAAKGNPTVLLPLFAPPSAVIIETPLGAELRMMRDLFLTQHAVRRFLGYMDSQWKRMMGESNRHTPNRPELIALYGWDTKYGSHALRLAYQGHQIASEGTLTLPLPEPLRGRVLSVKRGEVPRSEVSDEILQLSTAIEVLLNTDRVDLPLEADRAHLTEWSAYAHLTHWGFP